VPCRTRRREDPAPDESYGGRSRLVLCASALGALPRDRASERQLGAYSWPKRRENGSWSEAVTRHLARPQARSQTHFPPLPRSCPQNAGTVWGLEVPSSNLGAPMGKGPAERAFSVSERQDG
jgi:hypothetical protein